MNKAEIAEELGLTKAARELDGTTHIEVDTVFVDDDESGIRFELFSREMFVLKKVSNVLDQYNLEVDNTEGEHPESVKAVSTQSVSVRSI